MLLKNGSTGNYVMYLQYGLHIMCCPPGSFDSKFGSGTENAVKKYQGKKGLTQDGIVGDGTWNALVSDIKTIQQLLKNIHLAECMKQFSGWPCRFRHL